MRALAGMAAIGLVLIGLYASHVQGAGWVYEDEKLLPVAGSAPLPLWRGRGLAAWSWRYADTPVAAHALSLSLHLLVVGLAAALTWRLTASSIDRKSVV